MCDCVVSCCVFHVGKTTLLDVSLMDGWREGGRQGGAEEEKREEGRNGLI